MIRRLPLFLFVLLISLSNIYAQEAIDSLKNMPPEALIDAIKNAEPEEAKPYEEELLQRTIPDTTKIRVYFDIRKYFYYEGSYKRSRYYVDKVMDLVKTMRDKTFLGKAYLYQGNAYLMEWENYEALEAYYSALDIAEQTKNVKEEIVIRINIAIILTRVSNPKKALKVCRATLGIIDETQKNTRNYASMLTIITDVSLDLRDYKRVLEYADEGIKIINASLDYDAALVDLYTKKGAVYYYMENYDKAHFFLKKAKGILHENEITHKTLSVNIDYFSARTLYAQKTYRDAIHILEQIITSSKEISGYPKFIESHKWLSKCYEKMADTVTAYKWLKRHDELQDRFNEDKDEINYKIGKRTDDYIQNLQKREHDLKNKNKYVSILLIFILLILMVVIILYSRKQKSNKKRFGALMEKIILLEQQEQQPKEKSATVVIDTITINKILEKIARLEAQEYFLSLDCNLRTMGKKVKTNATYLSKIINDHKGKNFNEYINELRINYVLKKIKNDEKFRRFSVQAIATEIGYKSVNSFTKHFKSKTGLNPSYYIKNIKNIHKLDLKNKHYDF